MAVVYSKCFANLITLGTPFNFCVQLGIVLVQAILDLFKKRPGFGFDC